MSSLTLDQLFKPVMITIFFFLKKLAKKSRFLRNQKRGFPFEEILAKCESSPDLFTAALLSNLSITGNFIDQYSHYHLGPARLSTNQLSCSKQ